MNRARVAAPVGVSMQKSSGAAYDVGANDIEVRSPRRFLPLSARLSPPPPRSFQAEKALLEPRDRHGLPASGSRVECRASPLRPTPLRFSSLLNRRDESDQDTFRANALALVVCFIGLQGSYVTWGFIQEKVMTREYESGMFPSTVFLVCANRALALVVAGALMTYKSRVLRQPAPKAPFYQYSPCSVSNIASRPAPERTGRPRARARPLGPFFR